MFRPSCLSAGYILGLESRIEFDLDVIQWLFIFIEYIDVICSAIGIAVITSVCLICHFFNCQRSVSSGECSPCTYR